MNIPVSCPRASGRARVGAIICLVALAAALADVLRSPGNVSAAPAPEKRTPWTTGRVTGSPEAPPPFESQRLYPALTFKSPVDIAFAPGGDRAFVAEQGGKIHSFPNRADAAKADPFVDLFQVTDWKSVPGCRGLNLYSLTFHPRFAENHFVYLFYALEFQGLRPDPNGSRISRFTVVGDDVPRVDPASEKIIIQWQAGGHNGGSVKFANDGTLYVSTGDQANPNPPDRYDTGQDVSDLRSSILRIDVDYPDADRPYSIPRDNPFVKTPGARGEVWCYGLRNPWRMSVDRATGRLWVGDVGWELWETIHCAKPGGNYGWSFMEGPSPIQPNGRRGPTPVTPPLLALSHAEAMSVTGGVVYRGKRLPGLVGHYVFGDWDTRRLFAAKLVGEDKVEPHRTIAQTDQRIVSFGEDADGELYVVDYEGGGIHGIVPNPAAQSTSRFPRTLSDTGLFADVARQAAAPGVIPYSVNVPQWVDGATARRFVAIPDDGEVRWRTDDVFARLTRDFPKDSVLVRTFAMQSKAGEPAPGRNLETQLLHFDGKQWHGYTYRWRDDQADADLVDDAGAAVPLTVDDPSVVGGKRHQTWRYASRAQCLTCHNIHAGYVVGFHDAQLDRPHRYDDGGGRTVNQLAEMRRIGLLSAPYAPRPKIDPPRPEPYTLVDPDDAAAPLAERARSYLHGNCAHCHREHGGGAALIDLRKEKPLKNTRTVDQPPMLGGLGLEEPLIVAPGDPSRSVLFYRMAKTGSGRMPHVGAEVVDDRGVALVGRWIAEMQAPVGKGVGAWKDAPREALSETPGTEALDKLLGSTRGALSLIYALQDSGLPVPVRERVIARALASPSPAARDLFDRFSGRDMSPAPKLGAKFDRAKLLATPGDARRGREVFLTVAQCAACHAAGDVKGRDLGPDLSHVAARYDRAQLLENVVEPSKTIAEGFVTYDVLTADGDLVSGLLVRRDAAEVVIRDATSQVVRVPAGELKSVKPRALSAMPEGLLANLEPQQAADLLEWLASMK